jgi:hypothetical protein
MKATILCRLGLTCRRIAWVLVVGSIAGVPIVLLHAQEAVAVEETETVAGCEPKDLNCLLDALIAEVEAVEEGGAVLGAADDIDALIEIAQGIRRSLKEGLRPGIEEGLKKLKESNERIAALKPSRDKEQLQQKSHDATLALLLAGTFRGNALEDISDGIEALKKAQNEKQVKEALMTITGAIKTARAAQEKLVEGKTLIKEIGAKLKELDK